MKKMIGLFTYWPFFCLTPTILFNEQDIGMVNMSLTCLILGWMELFALEHDIQKMSHCSLLYMINSNCISPLLWKHLCCPLPCLTNEKKTSISSLYLLWSFPTEFAIHLIPFKQPFASSFILSMCSAHFHFYHLNHFYNGSSSVLEFMVTAFYFLESFLTLPFPLV